MIILDRPAVSLHQGIDNAISKDIHLIGERSAETESIVAIPFPLL